MDEDRDMADLLFDCFDFSTANVELARFCGKPGQLSPKARFWLFAGWLLPTRFKYVLSLLSLFLVPVY